MVKPEPPQDIRDSWPKPNFVDPEIRSHAIFTGITLAFTLVTLIIVGLRTYVRFFSLRAPGWDDYFIFAATLGAVAMCIAVNLAMEYGWDRHYWDQKPEWFEKSELFQWIIQVIFIILMTCTKVSALCTYLRASQGTRYRRFVWGTMIVVALWGIAFFFATVFECTPVHLYWTSKDGKGCTNEDARLLIATIVNIITDIIVVLMPIPIIIKLQIRRREKVTLGILMCLGGVATVASIVRTVVMSQSLTGLRYDMTWNSFIVWIWLIVECDLAIICISIPVLRVLVRRYLPRWSEKTGAASHNRSLPTHVAMNQTANNQPPTPLPLKHEGSLSSLMQEGKSVRNADGGIELYPRPNSYSSTGYGQQSPIVGYDRYGQPIMRDDVQKQEHHTGPRAF